MRFVKLRPPSGDSLWGCLLGDYVVALPGVSPEAVPASFHLVDAIDRGATVHPRSAVELLSPVDGTIYRLDGTYKGHVEDCVDDHLREAGMNELDTPSLWVAPDSSLTSPDEPVAVPPTVGALRTGVELGLLIGSDVDRADPESARDAVSGYVVCRSLRAADELPGLYGYRMFDGFLAVSESVEPDFSPPSALGIRVNGLSTDVRSTSELRFSIGELVSYASNICPLSTGDLVVTGDPTATDVIIEPGDTTTAWVEGIGSVRTPIVATDSDSTNDIQSTP